MKYISVCATIAIMLTAVAAHSDAPEMKQLLKKCAKESNIDMKELGDLKNTHMAQSYEGKCFQHCFLNAIGIIGDLPDGTYGISEERVAEIIKMKNVDDDKRQKIEGIITTCASLNEKNPQDKCELTGKILECSFEKAVEAGVNIMQ